MGDGKEWERGRMWEVEGWEERGMNNTRSTYNSAQRLSGLATFPGNTSRASPYPPPLTNRRWHGSRRYADARNEKSRYRAFISGRLPLYLRRTG